MFFYLFDFCLLYQYFFDYATLLLTHATSIEVDHKKEYGDLRGSYEYKQNEAILHCTGEGNPWKTKLLNDKIGCCIICHDCRV